MENLIIRQACPEDAEQILAYLKKIGAETDNLTFGAEGLPFSVEEEQSYIRAVLEAPRSAMYVAVKDGKIIGDASLTGLSRRMGHRAEVGLSVVKAHWNKGIGSLLMEKIIQYAKDSGIDILNLDVRADNESAIYLYQKFGFRVIGESPAFLKIGDEFVNVLLMYLDLR